MASRRWIILICLLGITTTADAYTVDDVIVEYWAGSGSSKMIWVVEFEGGFNYAFGYRWDGSTTSAYDSFLAVDTGGSLNFDATNWGTAESPDWFIDDIYYDGKSGTAGYWWEYKLSSDGQAWTQASSGMSSTNITNGDFHGWYWDFGNGGTDDPTTPVPEPAVLALLGFGAMLMRRNRT